MKIIMKEELLTLVNVLIEEGPKTVGVKSRGNKFVFDELNSAKELRLDYDVTILPPKKYFFPQEEILLKYKSSGSMTQTDIAAEPLVLIGLHPYDIAAIHQMDKVFKESKSDPYYRKKRESSTIIGITMQNVSPWCFADSMNCAIVDYGYDLMLTDIGGAYFVETGSEKGETLLTMYGRNLKDPHDEQIQIMNQKKAESATMCEQKTVFPLTLLPDLLKKNYENTEFWESHSELCYSCGSCVMVCPTCYCFDVKDTLSLSLKSGQRIRMWDGCLLEDFAKVASGENFRSTKLARYRHRYYKKGVYLFDRFGFVSCVGCGRCSSHCLPDIAHPAAVFNDLYRETARAGYEITPSLLQEVPVQVQEDATFAPKLATIIKKTPMTENETLFEIQLDDGSELNHNPGQFVQVLVFGVGEAPFSVTSSPTKKGSFELCIRKVGNVTYALHRMDVGEKIGIRGPFGNGFDVNSLVGCDMVFVAGGLGVVPLRSLINYVLDKRDLFGRVTILYGCKEPCEILFADEIREWEARTDTEQYLTVDRCPENVCWEGNIGVITTLVPNVNFTPTTVCALVVGPPIMYRFVVQSLGEMGVPDDHILVSLERRMKCAVGKCGHCQINNLYVCKDGPVFNYADIKDVPEAL